MATPEAAKHRDLEQRFRDLERRVRDLTSRALQRPKFAVTDGDLTISGGALVVDGGDFLLLDTDGSTVFRLGPQLWGDRGVSIFREDGALAVAVRKAFENSPDQTLEVRDRDGVLLLAEEALGAGLSRPFLHVPMHPVLATPGTLQHGPYGAEVPVATATWTTTHQAWFTRHNQYARFVAQVSASDATTAAEVRVVNADTSEVLGAFLAGAWTGTRAAGGTAHTEVESPAIFLPGAPEDDVSVALQVRRTAGTGTLQVALPRSQGAV